MERDDFMRQIEAMRQRMEEMGGHAQELAGPHDKVTRDALEQLRTALEELHVAAEEMQVQYEELVAVQGVLDEERRHYEDLFQFAPDGYLVTDAQGVIREANRAAETLLERRRDFLIGKPVSVMVGRQDHHEFRKRLESMRSGRLRQIRGWEVRVKPLRSSPFSAVVSVDPVRDMGGDLTGLRWLIRDTSREEALRVRQASLEAVLGQIPVAVWTTDVELQLTSVAGSALEASGLRIDQIAGVGVTDGSQPGSAPLTAHRRALESGPQSYEVEAGGRTFESHVTALQSRDGEVLGCVGVAVDVTSHKEIQGALEDTAERLREADALKDLLLRAVSHDLKNPLGVVLGLADTIDQRFGDLTAEEHKQLLRKVVGNAHRAVRIVRDLLDVDRIGRGLLEADRRVVDVGALVRNLTGTVDQGDHTLVTEISDAVAFVDPTYVRRIVDNLLVNAAAHTPVGTAIHLRVGPIDGGVDISVDDDGPGMSAEEMEAVSRTLSEGESATTSSAEQGIGLSLVRQFAELNGGRAWVETRLEGGTSFRVFLPNDEGSPT